MDNEMIDRVVKALDDAWPENHKDAALKVIKAMREPTEKMKTLVTEEMVITDKCYYCGGHIDGWRTMIDSITND